MSNFGTGNEAGEGFVNKIYTGVENFKVTHVCPTHEELKAIYGENAKAPQYTSTNDDGHQQVRIDFYLDNQPEEGEDSIKTKVSYFVTRNHKLSQTGKNRFINLYGQDAWLAPDGSIPDNMQWFNSDGKRMAYDGEINVIEAIKNLLNLPSLAKATNKSDAAAQFSNDDWNAMFSGNFASIKAIVAAAPNKIGYLLGAKTTDEGKVYQDVYNRGSLRQWAKNSQKFDYLRKNVDSAIEGGAYSKTNFGSPDYKLREFVNGAVVSNEAALVEEATEEFEGFV